MEELKKYLVNRICNLTKIANNPDAVFVRGVVETHIILAKREAFLEIVSYIDKHKEK